MRRTADITKALVAALALAALVVGLPVLLVVAVGWPLPHQLPHLQDITDTIGGRAPLETATVWKILALILWLAWLQIAAAVAAEVAAGARGGVPRSLPGLNLAHGLVAPLIAAVIIAWPAGPAGRAAASPAPPAATAPPPPAAAAAEATASSTPATEATTTIEHVVKRRDTLWDLAERYLGDGYRATELFELNRGRPQPDGGALTDPGVIRPGWVLQIPRPATPSPPAATSVTVQAGDTLWDIAADELHDGHRYTEIVDLNTGRPQPDGGALTDPDIIRPGWTLALPADAPATNAAPAAFPPPAPIPASPAPSSPPPTTAPVPALAPADQPPPQHTAPTKSAPSTHAAPTGEDDNDSVPSVPAVGLAALGVGAAGVVAALERRRRAQQRRRRQGERPAPDGEKGAAAERLLRSAAPPTGAAMLDAALRAAAAGRPEAFSDFARVEVRGGDVTLVFGRATEPAAGFAAVDGDPRSWRPTANAQQLAALGNETPPPVPALIAMGRTADDTEVLIDAEAAGAVFIHGDPAAVNGVVRGLAATVATAAWVDAADILLVGDDPALTPLLPGATTDLADAMARAERHARTVRRAVAHADADSVIAARLSSPTPEAFAPVVVISARHLDDGDLFGLRDVVDGGAGVVVIAAVDQPPGWGRTVTVAADGTVTLAGKGTAAVVGSESTRLAVIDEDQSAALAALFETAAASTTTTAPASPSSTRPVSTLLADLLAEVDVVVRVLGEVGAVRRTGDVEEPLVPTKQKSLEAIVYLALREVPVDREDLQAALWPAGANSAKTFHNAVWEARRMLGADTSGGDLLSDPTDGRYALSDRVVTDYGLLHELVATAAEADDPETASALLTQALKLVRGEPFTGAGRGYAWVAPHAGIIVAEVVDAAEELASMRLAAGDWRGAEWAARQGLKVFPCDERLYRLLMRAAHLSGNAAGVQRIFAELVAVVADPDDGAEPDDTVHPETIALLEELTSRNHRATA